MKLITRNAILSISLALAFGSASFGALADSFTTLPVASLPASLTYGNTFASSVSGTTFWDDYIFTIPNGSVNSLTSPINLDSTLGLSDLRARLYTGDTHQIASVVPGTLMSEWGDCKLQSNRICNYNRFKSFNSKCRSIYTSN